MKPTTASSTQKVVCLWCEGAGRRQVRQSCPPYLLVFRPCSKCDGTGLR